jgi:hypothetical protein
MLLRSWPWWATAFLSRVLGVPNVAVAEVNIGEKSEVVSAASPPGRMSAPKNRLFTTQPSGAITTAYDPDVKFLEDVPKELPTATSPCR